MDCPVVLQVFYGKDSFIEDVPDFIGDDAAVTTSAGAFLPGLPLWRFKGHLVYRWAVDYVSCTDDRWVMFGPFKDDDDAMDGIERHLSIRILRGYRIIPEHCAEDVLTKAAMKKGLQPQFWTDG
jgi:hypothetical protein